MDGGGGLGLGLIILLSLLCLLSNLLSLENKAIILSRVNSGMFGQTAKFGRRSCLFHTSIIGI